jgi:hypothetical protein
MVRTTQLVARNHGSRNSRTWRHRVVVGTTCFICPKAGRCCDAVSHGAPARDPHPVQDRLQLVTLLKFTLTKLLVQGWICEYVLCGYGDTIRADKLPGDFTPPPPPPRPPPPLPPLPPPPPPPSHTDHSMRLSSWVAHQPQHGVAIAHVGAGALARSRRQRHDARQQELFVPEMSRHICAQTHIS